MRVPVAMLTILVLTACQKEPVTWSDPVFRDVPLQPRDSTMLVPAVDPAMCEASLRVASAGHFSFATWWRVRNDSSSALMVSRADSNGTWGEPVVADSSDHSVKGCGRPAPAIAADSVSGYVHLAYFLEPSAGSGIFFAHSMDNGATFHSPVPIVFGKNPSRVSVAADGDRVAVAYEDPNSTEPLIGVSLSKTMGHIFEARVQGTPDNAQAKQPVVAVGKDSLRLWWSEYSPNPSISATRPAYRAASWK